MAGDPIPVDEEKDRARGAPSEATLRRMLDTANEAFVAMDHEGRIVEWNRQAARTFGWARDEVLGRPLAETLIPPDLRAAHEEGMRRYIETGEERVMYQRLRLPALVKDGGTIPIELTISSIELEVGPRFSAFMRDVSQEVAEEEDRERREQLLAEAQRVANLGSWEWDVGTDEVTWSDQLYVIFGVDRSTRLDYESYLELLPESERETVMEHVQRALEEQDSFAFEHTVSRSDGGQRRVQARGRVLVDAEGDAVRMVGIAQDITERVAREEERRELERERLMRAHSEALAEEAGRSEERYRTLADSIPQHVWTADASGVLDYMNSVGLEFYDVELEALASTQGQGLVHPDDLEPNLKAWERAIAEQEVYEARLRLRRHDGEYRWHLIRALPRHEPDGDDGSLKWYGTSTEIHAQVEAEAARDRALGQLASVALELEQTNRELDQFAHIASHDLRAPLRGIANLATFLEEDLADRLTAETREMFGLLKARVGRLEALIDGILTYSRAGRQALEPETVDVGDLVRELASMLSPPEGIDVVVDPNLPVLETPRVPLEQVFQNLMSNAFKYAPEEGGRVEIVGERRDGGLWRFSVSDNGPGIAPEFHDQVWQIFKTLRPRDEVEGTGIGLAVVQKTVEAVGGTVTLDSAEGAGARFTFEWPGNGEEDSG